MSLINLANKTSTAATTLKPPSTAELKSAISKIVPILKPPSLTTVYPNLPLVNEGRLALQAFVIKMKKRLSASQALSKTIELSA